jgi:hypothetical protein
MKSMQNKRRPGPPARDRKALALRLNPQLADWLQTLGDSSGLSRNEIIEKWLSSLMENTVKAERWFVDDEERRVAREAERRLPGNEDLLPWGPTDPQWFRDAFGKHFADVALELGVLTKEIDRDLLSDLDFQKQQENEALAKAWAEDRARGAAERARKAGLRLSER